MFTVIRYIGTVHPKRSNSVWECQCDCGKILNMRVKNLKSGNTKSCGCSTSAMIIAAHTSHGMRHSREYATWESMIGRCLNPNNPSYKDYGGRGIRVCRRWRKFENFYADMGTKPGSGREYSIDRIDVNGNYEPKNCRWATAWQQMNNTRKTVFVEYKGMKMSRAHFSKTIGVSVSMIRTRLKYGWSADKIVSLSESTRGSKTLKEHNK